MPTKKPAKRPKQPLPEMTPDEAVRHAMNVKRPATGWPWEKKKEAKAKK